MAAIFQDDRYFSRWLSLFMTVNLVKSVIFWDEEFKFGTFKLHRSRTSASLLYMNIFPLKLADILLKAKLFIISWQDESAWVFRLNELSQLYNTELSS